jgi:hypothetical protein
MSNYFDIVIPVGPNDISVIKTQLEYTKKNIIGYRYIYLVSCDASLNIDNCITIDEKMFPFSINNVAEYHGKNERNGWYFQQLLKLYAGFIIPDIMDIYLVIDSDTFFLKPTAFISNDTKPKCLYNYGFEHHRPYFLHMNIMHETLQKMINVSGICHHMIFEKVYVKEMMEMIEKKHSDLFWRIFLKMVSKKDVTGSGASEYEIYFSYMLFYHSDKIHIRELKWKNTNKFVPNETSEYNYVSYHYYMRPTK